MTEDVRLVNPDGKLVDFNELIEKIGGTIRRVHSDIFERREHRVFDNEAVTAGIGRQFKLGNHRNFGVSALSETIPMDVDVRELDGAGGWRTLGTISLPAANVTDFRDFTSNWGIIEIVPQQTSTRLLVIVSTKM